MRLWPALDILAHPASADLEEIQGLVLAALDEGGLSAVEERPAGWRIFFTTSEARDAAVATLAAAHLGLDTSAVEVSDEDWARRSQESIGAVLVGRVRIAPPWAVTAESQPPPGASVDPSHEIDPQRGVQPRPDLIEVVIQPSMGFGTGHHATTRLCVQILQQLDLVGRRVLDVGTGSGVLAIVAARLGARDVLAIDDDPDALESARENLETNGLGSAGAPPHPSGVPPGPRVALRRCDFRALPDPGFDLVTANLTGGLLLLGADALLAAVTPAGRLILSGITLAEEADVRARFESRLPVLVRAEEQGWVGLLFGIERLTGSSN
jgi:ribosomal protein L11 methyltransferase